MFLFRRFRGIKGLLRGFVHVAQRHIMLKGDAAAGIELGSETGDISAQPADLSLDRSPNGVHGVRFSR